MLLLRTSLLLSLLSPLASAALLPSPPAPLSSTLIDVLSADSDYTLLLRLIQRAKLVPTLNKLNGSTLFAPTNDAIERHRNQTKGSLWSSALDDDAEFLADNMQIALRQSLFYHLLNYTLKAVPEVVTPQLTLHYPALPIEPPTHEPPPSPPWLPVPGGLLGGEPQRLRTVVRDGTTFVGVDFKGQGGAKFVKDKVTTGNGNVYGIDSVLEVPQNLFKEVSRHPALTTIARLLPGSLRDSLTSSPHLTLFFPSDAAWSALDPIEMRYLESGFAEKDMDRIVSLHASGTGSDGHGQVGWSETWRSDTPTNFTSIEGHKLRVNVSDDGSATVSHQPIVEQDIYAANGVLHLVDSLLLSPDIFQLNAEKYLLALNATSFVSLLRAANLSHYVDDFHDGKPWTILAPRDDVFTVGRTSLSLSENEEDKPAPNGTDLARILRYHFIPGKLKPEDLEDRGLLGTELREDGLGGGRQMVEVSVHGSGKDGRVQRKGNGEIGFGGALVIGDAVEIGDSIIYVLSKILSPPTDVIETTLPSAHLSTFLTSVFATHLEGTLRTAPSTTVLVPHNSAWSPLGLLTDFLLLPESRELLKNVVLHHVIKEVIYPGSGVLDSKTVKTYATLEGSDIRIEAGRATASGGWASSTSSISPIQVESRGTLTETGVTHEIKGGLLIPRSVQVTVEDLATAGKGSIMIGLVQKAGFGGVLNGTMKLDLDEWDRGLVPSNRKGTKRSPTTKPKKEEVGWTLLCPRDEAFKGVNLTALLADEEGLKSFVRQHIIPVPASATALSWSYINPWARSPDDEVSMEEEARPLYVSDEATYSTLLSPNAVHGDIVFRLTGSNVNSFLVGIKGAKGKAGAADFARVLKWGRTTITSSSTPSDRRRSQSPLEVADAEEDAAVFFGSDQPTDMRSGVILIDRPLSPYVDGWWALWGQAILVGLVGTLGISGFWSLVVYWWRSKESEATFEPLGGHDDE